MGTISTNRLFQCCLLLILSLGASADVGRVKDRIYVKLLSNSPCFRLLNGTRQVGCQSARGGSHGVMHWIENDQDVDYVLNDPGGHAPFIVAMEMFMFRDSSRVMKLHNSLKVNGMLLFRSSESQDFEPFSEDATCPNDASSLYKNDPTYGSCQKIQWNKNATSYRFVDFELPIFLIHNETEQDILKTECFKKFNQPVGTTPPKYPLCAVELVMFNIAAGNAIRCMRRNTLVSGLDVPTNNCDPLKGYNVYAVIPSANTSKPVVNESVLMVAARMDSFSMFSEYDPGAESALGNVIFILSVVEALSRSKEFVTDSSAATGKYLMPVLFNGESLDYIGSSRMVWDLQNGRFNKMNLALHHLAFILEVNQISGAAKTDYFFHVDPDSLKNPKTKSLVMDALKNLSDYSAGVLSQHADLTRPLPPASVQRFLMVNRSIPTLVITDHEAEFLNTHYNSFSDVPNRINYRSDLASKMVKLSNAVVKYMLRWVSDGQMPAVPDSEWQVDLSLVEHLMDCFWSWPLYQCDIFDRLKISSRALNGFFGDPKNPNAFKRSYIGPAGVSPFIYQYLMAYFLGDRYLMPNDTAKCEAAAFPNLTDTIYTFTPMVDLFDNSTNSSYCCVSTVNVSMAKSPAFEISGYDFASGEYSTWMESVWTSSYIRVFLRSDPVWQGAVLTVGLLVLLLSLIIVYLVSSGSETFFAAAEVTAL